MANYGTNTLVLPNGCEARLERRINPDGTLGGWVSPLATIGSDAMVHETAIVGPGVNLAGSSSVGPNSVLI